MNRRECGVNSILVFELVSRMLGAPFHISWIHSILTEAYYDPRSIISVLPSLLSHEMVGSTISGAMKFHHSLYPFDIGGGIHYRGAMNAVLAF